MDDFNQNNNNNDINKNENNIIDENLNRTNRSNKRKGWIEKGKNMLNTDMFYIMLFICVCIIATTAVWVSKENVLKQQSLKNDENIIISGESDAKENASEVVKVDKNPKSTEDNTKKDTNEKNTNEESEDKKTVSQPDAKEVQKTKPKDVKASVNMKTQQQLLNEIILPVKGKVSLEYAKDTLVYSKTLDQWTTHLGLDISTGIGNEVVAVLDGKVTKIETTDKLGIVITIDHGEGILAKYGNVSANDMVSVGQNVKKRQTISGIGKPVGFEIAQGPHLHFELLIGGKSVNPSDYLKQIK